MLFRKHKNKRHFIHGLLSQDFRIPFLQNGAWVLNADHAQRVLEVLNWHGLHTQHIVGVKNSFKILKFKELVAKLVNVFVKSIVFAEVVFLEWFEAVEEVLASVDRPFL